RSRPSARPYAGRRRRSRRSSRAGCAPPPCAPSGLLLHDLEQLDLEHERRAGLDRGRRAAIAVGDVGRTDEPGLAAHLHLAHALGPALDDAVQGERRRLVALVGAVELGAVDERAAIVDLHLVGRRRLRARPGLQVLVEETRRGLLDALLGGRLLLELLARLL